MSEVTMQDVRRVLEPEEPDYAAMARLGSGSLPHLRDLVQGPDPMLASKAAYAAGLLEGDQGHDVITIAALSEDPIVRVAAAGAAINLPVETAADILSGLAADTDPGVRKVALTSLPPDAPEDVVDRLSETAAEAAEEMPPGVPPPPPPPVSDGTGYGTMPGESADTGAAGRMPGEGRSAAPGRMPGESG
ncbi:HEAT repeat domain-containing protein [Streptomyces litchfieldiae]|uniref:HEAT repeat domain-containing protein n=1 Tax=Streptomyces litchfieldiae TaxID=3075543 RepID=A0ABU2MT84_9ACTN|nr:HEAT repeat domain-containing protein [Streptomyces sp. DSM 44938]MDT0344533.1 hypothetical protein [Streptomyces sp. DSM 44938]